MPESALASPISTQLSMRFTRELIDLTRVEQALATSESAREVTSTLVIALSKIQRGSWGTYSRASVRNSKTSGSPNGTSTNRSLAALAGRVICAEEVATTK